MKSKRLILFIDSGDTLVNEDTEIRDAEGFVIKSELIDGAEEALRLIHDQGYTVALVADGEARSFDNIYKQNNLEDCFDTRVISGTLGIEKPAMGMFKAAMDQLNLSPVDKERIVMVGNNLQRDILGANRFGIVSVWIDWSPRYFHEPRNKDEIPDYIIHSPSELPALLYSLEEHIREDKKIKKET